MAAPIAETASAGVALNDRSTPISDRRDMKTGAFATQPAQRLTAPVLAYSFGDDKWGTPQSVDAMMRAYPNLERRHVEPADVGLASIGHVGYFKPASQPLWQDTIDWLDDR